MKENRPIGLFDSGIGGLTIFDEVAKEIPQENLIYFADNENCPYGPKSSGKVLSLSLRIINYLIKKEGCKLIIVACNTAHSVLSQYQENFPVPLIGPIDIAIDEALKSSKNQQIGLLATERTIRTGIYQEIFHKENDVKLFPRPVPELVTLAEKGDFSSSCVNSVLLEHLNPLMQKNVDTIILGCTHFAYFIPVIKNIIPSNINLISPGRKIALMTREFLSANKLLRMENEPGRRIYLTSNKNKISQRFLKIGENFLSSGRPDFMEKKI